MDALKRAQQLRLKEFKGTPFYRPSQRKNKGGLTSLRRIGTMIGAGLVCLFALLVFFERLVPPLPITKPDQAVVVIKKKPSIQITKRTVQEPSKDILSQPMEIVTQPKETLSPPKDRPSSPQVEKSPPKKEPSVEKKREEPPHTQMAQGKKAIEIKPLPPLLHLGKNRLQRHRLT